MYNQFQSCLTPGTPRGHIQARPEHVPDRVGEADLLAGVDPVSGFAFQEVPVALLCPQVGIIKPQAYRKPHDAVKYDKS